MARPKGRPPKCTPETIARVAEGIRLGMTREAAAVRGGVHVSTYYRWMAEAEAGRGGMVQELRDAVTRAEADGQAALLAAVQKAARGENADWRAAAWILERRHREGFGREPQVQVSVDVTAERARLREAAAQLTDADLGLVAEA